MPKKKLSQSCIYSDILEFQLSLEFTLAFNRYFLFTVLADEEYGGNFSCRHIKVAKIVKKNIYVYSEREIMMISGFLF